MTTNNVQAGEISCQYIVDKLGGKGDVVIENGPQVSAAIDRVVGCKQVFAKNPGIKVLSSDEHGKGSREGGLTVAQGYLTRFPKIDARRDEIVDLGDLLPEIIFEADRGDLDVGIGFLRLELGAFGQGDEERIAERAERNAD